MKFALVDEFPSQTFACSAICCLVRNSPDNFSFSSRFFIKPRFSSIILRLSVAISLVNLFVNLGAFLVDALIFRLRVKRAQRVEQIGKEPRGAFLALGAADLRLVNVLSAD